MTILEAIPEINANQVKYLKRLILENVIGEDDAWNAYHEPLEAPIRNELRDEQRAKLTKELESER